MPGTEWMYSIFPVPTAILLPETFIAHRAIALPPLLLSLLLYSHPHSHSNQSHRKDLVIPVTLSRKAF